MNLPSLPTDSLYKFLAIASLLGILFTMWLTYTRYHELLVEMNRVNVEAAVLSVDLESSEDSLAYFDKVVDRISSDTTSMKSSTTSKNSTDIRKEIEKVLPRFRKLQSDFLNQKRNTARLSQAFKIILASKEQIDRESSFLLYVQILLVIVFVGSIRFWYNRNQRFQDAIIEAEAKKALASINSQPDHPSPPSS